MMLYWSNIYADNFHLLSSLKINAFYFPRATRVHIAQSYLLYQLCLYRVKIWSL